jgi:inorganic triphosphatase YgiF
MNKIELKLGLPEAAAPSVSERLAHLGARVAQIESSYWDSADHRLASARMSLHSATYSATLRGTPGGVSRSF